MRRVSRIHIIHVHLVSSVQVFALKSFNLNNQDKLSINNRDEFMHYQRGIQICQTPVEGRSGHILAKLFYNRKFIEFCFTISIFICSSMYTQEMKGRNLPLRFASDTSFGTLG